MNAKNLLQSLKNQELNLDQLITVLEVQKKAIVKGDFTVLEGAISTEQKILRNVEQEEHARVKEVNEIANHYSLKLKDNSLDNFMTEGKKYLATDLNELMKARLSLKEKVTQIINVNSQLKSVVDFSRGMIKETMVILAGSNKHLFVNKRV